MSLARLGGRGGPVVDVVRMGIVSVDVDILSLSKRYFLSGHGGQRLGASTQAEISAPLGPAIMPELQPKALGGRAVRCTPGEIRSWCVHTLVTRNLIQPENCDSGPPADE